ncbi:MAG: PIG-L family deacetylase [Spirochaetaceae bacterium]|nr:MAG: PIG-L family deacetylase [Spirochaetaceae bacterium]
MNGRLTVMAIGPHPDDLEVLCGGTLALYSKGGHKVFMYYVTDGTKGGLSKPKEVIKAERAEEAKNSAALIDAVSFGGDFVDGEVVADMESRLVVIDAIRRCSPEVIIAPHPNDYHTDHVNVSKLVFEAIYHAAIPHTVTKHPPLKVLPILYYMDTVTGIGFVPEQFVDITEVIEVKKNMMRAHATQIDFVKEHHGVDFIDLIEISGRFRGYQCGVRYAEGFVLSQGWNRVPTSRLLP